MNKIKRNTFRTLVCAVLTLSCISLGCTQSQGGMDDTITKQLRPSVPMNQPPQVQKQKRWMFLHYSHAKWWIMDNMEANPNKNFGITGVFLVFTDGNPLYSYTYERAQEATRRFRKLGIEVIIGKRQSHQSWEEYPDVKTTQWQDAHRMIHESRTCPTAPVMVDMEPYYTATAGQRRYHTPEEYPELVMACQGWQSFRHSVFALPAGNRHIRALLSTLPPEIRHYYLDERTYRSSSKDLSTFRTRVEQGRKEVSHLSNVTYVPGFYLRKLRDKGLMEDAKDLPVLWFYAQTSPNHPDNVYRFGTPDWSPIED